MLQRTVTERRYVEKLFKGYCFDRPAACIVVPSRLIKMVPPKRMVHDDVERERFYSPTTSNFDIDYCLPAIFDQQWFRAIMLLDASRFLRRAVDSFPSVISPRTLPARCSPRMISDISFCGGICETSDDLFAHTVCNLSTFLDFICLRQVIFKLRTAPADVQTVVL